MMSASRRFKVRPLSRIASLALCGAAALGLAATVHAATVRPKAAVMMGDSFASGEGGRWRGNSQAEIGSGNRNGTDGAAYFDAGWHYEPEELAYETYSYSVGANKSLYAPVTYLKATGGLPALYPNVFNLAASGAETKHVIPYDKGGQNFRTYAPQLEQLKTVTNSYDVDLIVIGVGGNDAKFGPSVRNCIDAYTKTHTLPGFDSQHCKDEIRDDSIPKMLDVYYNVGKVLSETKALMAERGQTGYKIVLLGVPSITPSATHDGSAAVGRWKWAEDQRGGRGCPIRDADGQYVNNVLVRKLNETLRAAAHRHGVDFISTESVFKGHRLCEASALRSTSTSIAGGAAEWVRWLDFTVNTLADLDNIAWAMFNDGVDNLPTQQGVLQESFHPNFYGQKAIGHCLRQYAQNTLPSPKSLSCVRLGNDPDDVAMSQPRVIDSFVDGTDRPIPDANGTLWASQTVTFAQPADGQLPGYHYTRQIMSLTIDIEHPKKGNLEITMFGPDGKLYFFRGVNPNDGGAWPSAGKAYQFYHEGPLTQPADSVENVFTEGLYTLRIRDLISGNAGTLKSWRLDFF